MSRPSYYLRTLRYERQLTQAKLAKKSGVPQNCISRYETNRDANPPWGAVRALAAALRVDPLGLRFGPDPKLRRRPARLAVTEKARVSA